MSPTVKTILTCAGVALVVYLLLQLAANYGYDLASILPRPGAAAAPVTPTNTVA